VGWGIVSTAGSGKAAGVRKIFEPHKVFRRPLIRRITPLLDIAAPSVATVLLADGVVLPPLGQLDVYMPVDV
jgi:hypothetical protein